MSEKRQTAGKTADGTPASAGGMAVEVEVGIPVEARAIVAEMRDAFPGGDAAGEIVREYCDRLEATFQAAAEGAARNIENHIRESGGLAKAVEAAMAHGVAWDETNTEPACKTFRVEIRFDIADRLKLGMLAARCRETPERFLESQLRARFDEMADKVFYGGGKKRTEADDAYTRSFEALYLAALESTVGKEGRLAFRPAIMA